MELVQKFVGTRKGTLFISVIAALIAGGMILAYLQRYRNSVKAEAAPVTVLVAAQAIPRGTPGSVIASKGLFTTTSTSMSGSTSSRWAPPECPSPDRRLALC